MRADLLGMAFCCQSRAEIDRRCLVGADCGGKFEVTALFATRKWDLGGKLGSRADFATRVEL